MSVAMSIAVAVLLEELVKVFVNADIYKVPVIKPAAFYHFIGDIKAERLYQMQPCAGRCAGAGYRSGVMRYLRLDKNNIKHLN